MGAHWRKIYIMYDSTALHGIIQLNHTLYKNKCILESYLDSEFILQSDLGFDASHTHIKHFLQMCIICGTIIPVCSDHLSGHAGSCTSTEVVFSTTTLLPGNNVPKLSKMLTAIWANMLKYYGLNATILLTCTSTTVAGSVCFDFIRYWDQSFIFKKKP